jgi:hypothetical protein
MSEDSALESVARYMWQHELSFAALMQKLNLKESQHISCLIKELTKQVGVHEPDAVALAYREDLCPNSQVNFFNLSQKLKTTYLPRVQKGKQIKLACKGLLQRYPDFETLVSEVHGDGTRQGIITRLSLKGVKVETA